jgi:hypothetical protein
MDEYAWMVERHLNRYVVDDYGPWFRLTDGGEREHERRPYDYPYDPAR